MDCGACESGPAIVGGCGHLGSRIAAELLDRGCVVVVIDRDSDNASLEPLRKSGCTIVIGDICDDGVLEEAGITSASCFITATGDDHANLEAAISARQKNEGCAVVARLYDQALGERVEKVFDIRALSASYLASPAFVSAATDDSIICALTVDGCCLGIRSSTQEPNDSRSVSITKDGHILVLADDLDSDNCFCASVHSSSRHVYSRRHKPRSRKRKRRTLAALRPTFLLGELASMWMHTASITKNLFVALLGFALVSVLVFWTAGHMSPLDALYFVVTTMTTIGYGDFNLQNAPGYLKIYGIVMMLGGAALLATVYAVIADRVLAARVESLLGRRRVNKQGHTIVVGLGKVGYRVARELSNLGLDVVGVESVDDTENVNAARGLLPVIIGDAARSSILCKAAVDTADAVLALTDDSLLNLSVALSAREHNPRVRTIVRTYDVKLAEKFAWLGIDNAFSTSAIAAPAFVDAAIFPDVVGSFRFEEEDILVLRVLIDGRSALLGKTPLEFGSSAGLVVVAAADGTGSHYHAVDYGSPMREGQRVLALATRATIDGLHRAR